MNADDYRCMTCKAWRRADHVCPPQWRVYIGEHHDPDDAFDGRVAYGHDPESVAAEAVKEWDDERYLVDGDAEQCILLPRDDRARAIVQSEGGTDRLQVSVGAETVVEYRGRLSRG